MAIPVRWPAPWGPELPSASKGALAAPLCALIGGPRGQFLVLFERKALGKELVEVLSSESHDMTAEARISWTVEPNRPPLQPSLSCLRSPWALPRADTVSPDAQFQPKPLRSSKHMLDLPDVESPHLATFR